MSKAIAECLDEAIDKAVTQVIDEDCAVGDAHPRDSDAYVRGQKEMVYDVGVELFEAEESKLIPIEVIERGDKWEVKTL